MKEFLTENWFVLILGIAFLVFIVYLAVTKQWEKIRGIAYALMLQAERVFGDGEGKKKFEAVFEKLYYGLIPAWLRVFVSPEDIRKKLQERYDLAKDYLDNGKLDGSQLKPPNIV